MWLVKSCGHYSRNSISSAQRNHRRISESLVAKSYLGFAGELVVFGLSVVFAAGELVFAGDEVVVAGALCVAGEGCCAGAGVGVAAGALSGVVCNTER